MVTIRLAGDYDNAELLEKMCPQGTDIALQFDRSPDFFSRSRIYEKYMLFVAEEEGKIVGTIGAASKRFKMRGNVVDGIYIYDLRVHPKYRRRGIGSKLVQYLIKEAKADFAYGSIMENNYPSIALFKKMGFHNIHDLLHLNILLYKRKETLSCKIRQMTAEDVPQVVDLINSYYQEYDFFAPQTIDAFLNKTKELPGYGLSNIQVVEKENRIVACAGLWDCSTIFRVSVLQLTVKLKMLTYFLRFINLFTNTMKLPSIGEPFKIMYVRDFAYRAEADTVRELISHCISLAL